MERDRQAERIRSLILLRATCESALERLDDQHIDDLALAIQITQLCDALADECERTPHRRPPGEATPESA